MKKKIAVIALSLIILLPAIYILGFPYLLHVSDIVSVPRTANEELKKDIDSYNIVVDYLKTYIEENPDREHICLLADTYEKGKMRLYDINMYPDDITKNPKKLEFSDEVNDALFNIDDHFGGNPDYSFDVIRIKDGRIAFETLDGEYELVYALDESVNKKSIKNAKKDKHNEVYVTKGDDNWYHVVTFG